jgi:signal transduction histidine kinase
MRLQSLARTVRLELPVDPTLLDRALANVRALETLINDLLDASRVAAGGMPLTLARTSLRDVVREAVESAREATKGHDIILSEAASDLLVEGDPARLGQLVANLLDNAIKYSHEGDPIRVDLSAHEAEAWIAVTDQGIGIPEDVQPHVFQRYFRAQNASKHGTGLGLGLYICRDIVERHGGRIWVESKPGAGATFFAALPILAGGAEEAGRREAAEGR